MMTILLLVNMAKVGDGLKTADTVIATIAKKSAKMMKTAEACNAWKTDL